MIMFIYASKYVLDSEQLVIDISNAFFDDDKWAKEWNDAMGYRIAEDDDSSWLEEELHT